MIAVSTQAESFAVPGWLWVAFLLGITVMLLADLFLIHNDAHEVTIREAAITSAIWVAIGLSFSLVLWAILDGSAATEYLTGYVIEKSLSVDNVFVWAVVFQYFAVPPKYQHRVLYWGIFGALGLRAMFIFIGAAALESLDWMTFLLGGFLIFTAVKVVMQESDEIHPERNPVLKLVRRLVPVTAEYHGQKLLARVDGARFATPLFVVLIMIEVTDLVFAVDSVPAILAVSRDRFVVFSSNAMAILGLRAMYFLLAGVKDRLIHLDKGLGVILAFIGVKMILSRWYEIDTLVSLLVIALVLTIAVVASLRATRSLGSTSPSGGESDPPSAVDAHGIADSNEASGVAKAGDTGDRNEAER